MIFPQPKGRNCECCDVAYRCGHQYLLLKSAYLVCFIIELYVILFYKLSVSNQVQF